MSKGMPFIWLQALRLSKKQLLRSISRSLKIRPRKLKGLLALQVFERPDVVKEVSEEEENSVSEEAPTKGTQCQSKISCNLRKIAGKKLEDITK